MDPSSQQSNQVVLPKVLTIAGSDSSGGAGIQADLKTFGALHCYGASVLTALTAQNTVGVQGIFEIPADFVGKQIESVLSDVGADCVKIGMLANRDIVKVVVEKLTFFKVKNLVTDPVIISKTGHRLVSDECVEEMARSLFPISTVITPNLPEAKHILNVIGRPLEGEITDIEGMKKAAFELKSLGSKYVLIKGGHLPSSLPCIDILFDGTDYVTFSSERIETKHTHGTGCFYAAVIASKIAMGETVQNAVKFAKTFLLGAIQDSSQRPPIGKGFGPLDHFYLLEKHA